MIWALKTCIQAMASGNTMKTAGMQDLCVTLVSAPHKHYRMTQLGPSPSLKRCTENKFQDQADEQNKRDMPENEQHQALEWPKGGGAHLKSHYSL